MRPHDCPEEHGYRCPVCERAIDAAESDRYAPTGYGDTHIEADRYERWLDRIGEGT